MVSSAESIQLPPPALPKDEAEPVPVTSNVFELSQVSDEAVSEEPKVNNDGRDLGKILSNAAPVAYAVAVSVGPDGNVGRTQHDFIYSLKGQYFTYMLEAPKGAVQLGPLKGGVSMLYSFSDRGERSHKTAGISVALEALPDNPAGNGNLFITIRGANDLHVLDALKEGELNGDLEITFGYEHNIARPLVAALTKISPKAGSIAAAAREAANLGIWVAPVWGGKATFENGELVSINIQGNEFSPQELMEFFGGENPLSGLPPNVQKVGEMFVSAASKDNEISEFEAAKIAVSTYNIGGMEALQELTAETASAVILEENPAPPTGYEPLPRNADYMPMEKISTLPVTTGAFRSVGMDLASRDLAINIVAELTTQKGMSTQEAVKQVLDVYIKGFPEGTNTGIKTGDPDLALAGLEAFQDRLRGERRMPTPTQ